jgi:hypothetical protein
MTEYESRLGTPEVSRWAFGGVTFAAWMLILVGVFQAMAGLAAILARQ